MKIKKEWFVIFIIALVSILYFGVCIKGNINIDDELIFNSLSDRPKASDLISVFSQKYNGSDYRPIVIFTYVIEQLIFGKIHLSISHGINVFLYFLIGITVYLFLKRIPIQTKINHNYFALFTTILFLIHPIHSSVVSSLKSRDNLLSMLFGMIGLVIFTEIIKTSGKKRIILLLLLFIVSLIALLSKLDAYGIIFSYILYLIIFYPKKWKLVLYLLLLPIILVNLWQLLFTSADAAHYVISNVMIDENDLVANPTFLNKISCAATSLFYYTKFMIIPKGYYFYFGYKKIILYKLYHPIVVVSIIFHLVLILFAFYTYKKHKIITFAIFFYLLTLAYCLNIYIAVAGVVADRYAFIASLSFCIITGYLIALFLSKENKLSQYISAYKYRKWILLLVLMLFYYPFTVQRNKDWKDKISLIEKDMPHLQTSFQALRIASSVYQDMAKASTSNQEKISYLNKSNEACIKAISIYDSNLVVWIRLANNQFILGNKKVSYNLLYEAINRNDTVSGIYSLLATFYEKDGQNDSAILNYEKAIYYDKNTTSNYVNLTELYNKKGEFNKAKALNTTLISNNLTLFEPYQNLANIALYQRDTLLATSYFLKAFKNGMSNTSLAKGIQEYLINNKKSNTAAEFTPYLDYVINDETKYIP